MPHPNMQELVFQNIFRGPGATHKRHHWHLLVKFYVCLYSGSWVSSPEQLKKFNHTPQTKRALAAFFSNLGICMQKIRYKRSKMELPCSLPQRNTPGTEKQLGMKSRLSWLFFWRSCHDIRTTKNNLVETCWNLQKHSLALGYTVLQPSSVHPTYTTATHHDVAGNRPVEHTHGVKLEFLRVASSVVMMVFGTKWSIIPVEHGIRSWIALRIKLESSRKRNFSEIC